MEKKKFQYQESYEDENGNIKWRNISNPDLAQSDTRRVKSDTSDLMKENGKDSQST